MPDIYTETARATAAYKHRLLREHRESAMRALRDYRTLPEHDRTRERLAQVRTYLRFCRAERWYYLREPARFEEPMRAG